MRHCFELNGRDHLLWLCKGEAGYRLMLDEKVVPVSLDDGLLRIGSQAELVHVAWKGDTLFVHAAGAVHEILFKNPVLRHAAPGVGESEDVLRAPMPGAVVAISSLAGQAVTRGEVLMIIESMKLETAIRARRDGVVEVVHVGVSQSFERDAPLVTLAPQEEA